MNEKIKQALLRAHNEKHGIVPPLSPRAQEYLDRAGGLKHEAIKLLEKERMEWRKSTMLTTGGGQMFFMMTSAADEEEDRLRSELMSYNEEETRDDD